MGLDQLDNCPQCGNVFVKGVRDICESCYQEEEEQFTVVSQYLRGQENRKGTIADVSKETGIAEKQIAKFIRQGRIDIEGMPHLGYPCDSCGKTIRESNLCSDCRQHLTQGMKELLAEEGKQKEKELNQQRQMGYQQLKNRFQQRNR